MTSSTGFSKGKVTWYLTKLTEATLGFYTAGVSTDPKACVKKGNLTEVSSGISYYYVGCGGSVYYRNNGYVKVLFGGKKFSEWKKGETLTINLNIDNSKISFSKNGQILGGSLQLPIGKPTYHPVISVKRWDPEDYQQFKLSF